LRLNLPRDWVVPPKLRRLSIPSVQSDISERIDMKLIAATSFALFAIVVATTAFGAAPPLVTATPVARATLHQSYRISVRKPADLIVVKVKVPPGGSFGWHSHPSAVAVAVTSGTLTLYDSRYPNCGPKRFSRGQGFVEPRAHVHLARNEGTKPVTLYATYLGVPPRAQPNVPASAPTNCPA
jgi:quercetin dioxygenase-like cupin family protein